MRFIFHIIPLLCLLFAGCDKKPKYSIPRYPDGENTYVDSADYNTLYSEDNLFNDKSDTVDINSQILIFFKKDISSYDAAEKLKRYHVNVIASRLGYGYFFVDAGSEKEADRLIAELKYQNDIDFVIRNQEVVQCGVSITVVDNFSIKSRNKKITHGEMVVKAMSMRECGAVSL